jgi:hypothetical protein
MSNPTSNYSFQMPTSTDLVTDLPADFEVFGQAVDTQMKTNADAATQKATLTTTGDVYYASAASTPARLAIGSSNQVLTVSGGVPAWVTPAGGSKSYSLLNPGGTSLTGSSTTVSGISDVDDLVILIVSASTGSASSNLQVQINSIVTNYASNRIVYNWNATYNSANYNTSTSTGFTSIFLAAMGSNAADTFTGSVRISGCNSTGSKAFTAMGGGDNYNGKQFYLSQGVISASAVVSSVKVLTGDTFDAGTVYVYGAA